MELLRDGSALWPVFRDGDMPGEPVLIGFHHPSALTVAAVAKESGCGDEALTPEDRAALAAGVGLPLISIEAAVHLLAEIGRFYPI